MGCLINLFNFILYVVITLRKYIASFFLAALAFYHSFEKMQILRHIYVPEKNLFIVSINTSRFQLQPNFFQMLFSRLWTSPRM